MKREFHVTGLGLKIDGRMIMPGSKLNLNSQPPSHWQRFGEVKNVMESKPAKELEVATPNNDELEELQALYKDQTGEEPDGRWGVKKLKSELGL